MRLAAKTAIGLGGAVMALCGAALAAALQTPGGGSPSHPARNYDRQLTSIAREAIPLIAAVDGFYAAYHSCPQPSQANELAMLRAALTAGYVAEIHGRFVALHVPGKLPGWTYDTSDEHPTSCSLWRRLGWDPALIWRRDGGRTYWVFDPGDGSREKPILLNLGNDGR
jgi:hypothetical protein